MLDQIVNAVTSNVLDYALTAVIIYLVPLIGKLGYAFIEGRKEQVNAFLMERNAGVVATWVNKLSELAKVFAGAEYQNFLKFQKKALADGKITPLEMKQYYAEAKARCMGKLKDYLSKAPSFVIGLVEDKLEDIFESAIPKLKASHAGVPAVNPSIPSRGER
jgi:hypothetical protein